MSRFDEMDADAIENDEVDKADALSGKRGRPMGSEGKAGGKGKDKKKKKKNDNDSNED